MNINNQNGIKNNMNMNLRSVPPKFKQDESTNKASTSTVNINKAKTVNTEKEKGNIASNTANKKATTLARKSTYSPSKQKTQDKNAPKIEGVSTN